MIQDQEPNQFQSMASVGISTGTEQPQILGDNLQGEKSSGGTNLIR